VSRLTCTLGGTHSGDVLPNRYKVSGADVIGACLYLLELQRLAAGILGGIHSGDVLPNTKSVEPM
jgi:hypothetical protein